MRKLVVTRGHQGSGKSTVIGSLGLDAYTLCPDDLRLAFAAPIMGAGGDVGISQEHEGRVWRWMRQLLSERMGRGELLVIDATHRARRDFKPYLKLAEEHRYEVACLDFSSQPIAMALERNQGRCEHAVVPEAVIQRTWAACQTGTVPDEVRRFCWDAEDGYLDAFRDWLSVPIIDAGGYRCVHHIGDLQGCVSNLRELYPTGKLDPDALHLFVGDLCDRGPENAQVLRFMLGIIGQENVRVHWGNHEDHLHDWARGREPRSTEFRERTLPQLEAAGISADDVEPLCAALVDVTLYEWRGKRVIVNHAGLATVPAHPERISTAQYARGTGHYPDPVDERFSKNAPEGWYQVHGHRNQHALPIVAGTRSFNLEGQVEEGGHLRAVTLGEGGFTTRALRNRVFVPAGQRRLRAEVRRLMPDWVTPEQPEHPLMDAERFEGFRTHELVTERTSESNPHVASYNFSRDAFLRRQWDDLTIRARGLFVDTGSREIVARSYDKFFNLDERPETRPEALEQNLVFPVDAYVKENGYLGILGYDRTKDALFFTSKATPDSPFAGWFREIVCDRCTAGQLEMILRYLRDTHTTMTFEVIDPVRDPHIIIYDEPRVILLDVIRRHTDFAALPFERLKKVGATFGLEVKRRGMRFDDWPSLSGWLDRALAHGYRYRGDHVEGFVLEDAAGFQTKIKLDFYSFWKRMRGLKDRILRVRGTNRALQRDISDPRVLAFHDWCQRQPDDLLRQNITALRQTYLAGIELPVDSVPPPPPKPDKALVGYERALAGVARLPEIKAATADQLLLKALEDDQKMAILHRSEVRVALVLAATDGASRVAAAEALGRWPGATARCPETEGAPSWSSSSAAVQSTTGGLFARSSRLATRTVCPRVFGRVTEPWATVLGLDVDSSDLPE